MPQTQFTGYQLSSGEYCGFFGSSGGCSNPPTDAQQEKQWIAESLIRLGDRSDLYFDYLAGFAKVAVEDRAPNFVKYDSQGRGLRGEFSAEFQECKRLVNRGPRAPGL